MSKVKSQKSKVSSSGFILILAVVVSSILLSIGVGIANFALKELILSATGRESMYAYYAADSGIECAYYWDNIRGENGIESAFLPESTTEIECNDVSGIPQTDLDDSAYKRFEFTLKNQSNCDRILVGKTYDPGRRATSTRLRSWGFNTNCDAVNPRKVDRAIFVRY